jgi:hypothetical protein
MNDAERLAGLRAAKLRALVRTRWDLPDDAVVRSFPAGATVTDPNTSTTWVSTEDDAARRLGAALAVALRAGSDALQVIVEDADDAGVLARRAAGFEFSVKVWTVEGTELVAAVAAPPAPDPAPAPEAELYRPVLEGAGLEPVVEGGHLLGELLGLEVARVVVDEDGTARVEAGVGRFDREAGTMVRAGMAEADALHVVIDLVAPVRRADAERHPMNQLVRDRWMRAVVVANPALVGAAELHPVGSARPRANLTEDGVASAIGVDLEGRPLVVTTSSGVFLDLVPSAVDDRLSHDPTARLVVVVAERDSAPITEQLIALVPNAELRTVPDDWARAAAPS